ncbi:hypothetical protein CC86DRAFT_454059 [Ophiobolus disseminans]|uniref:Uncharacterized protein n=1 Tax=Ophiobolus disseminans TaxID=1469910 RepID=A0A6A7A8G5_9PLEO|nr:hypothetical protein CC86DRAFT_454059 [Ophiobolus disseminans]
MSTPRAPTPFPSANFITTTTAPRPTHQPNNSLHTISENAIHPTPNQPSSSTTLPPCSSPYAPLKGRRTPNRTFLAPSPCRRFGPSPLSREPRRDAVPREPLHSATSAASVWTASAYISPSMVGSEVSVSTGGFEQDGSGSEDGDDRESLWSDCTSGSLLTAASPSPQPGPAFTRCPAAYGRREREREFDQGSSYSWRS